uniref:Uncharacterized protein n=1 Tax=Sander lucioperca TaxID=283035 RepID=A0A8C9ZI37_SANLU
MRGEGFLLCVFFYLLLFSLFVLITDYLSHNDTAEVTDSTIWEAFKAVMRGNIIAYEAKLNKDKKKKLTEITGL